MTFEKEVPVGVGINTLSEIAPKNGMRDAGSNKRDWTL